MSFEVWTIFFIAYLAISLAPGPNVLMVLKNVHRYGYRIGLVGIMGNLTCQLMIVIAVSVGAGTLLASAPKVFLVYKLVGGGYLVYLGLKALMSSNKGIEVDNGQNNGVETTSSLGIFRDSFVVSLANPKTVVFLTAFLPQFVDHHQPIAIQFATMFVTMSIIVTTVHLIYSIVTQKVSMRYTGSGLKRLVSKLTGLTFIGVGGRIMFSNN